MLIVIIRKGLNGLTEVVGGLLLLFVTPDSLHHLAAVLTRGELSEDPTIWSLATFCIQRTESPGCGDLRRRISVGARRREVVLVLALLLNKLWAYPCMIIVLLIFIRYQLYRIALQPSAPLIVLTVFDALIVMLTWLEYRRQRQARRIALPEALEPLRRG